MSVQDNWSVLKGDVVAFGTRETGGVAHAAGGVEIHMKTNALILAGAAGAALAAGANATVYFTFDDPSTAREMTYTAGGGGSDGHVTYSGATTVDLVVDGSEHGWGIVEYAATLTMDIDVGTAIGAGTVWTALTAGTFTFSFGGFDILSGVFDGGVLGTFGTSGAMLGSSTNGTLVMSVGGDVLTQFEGTQILPVFDAGFSLANITPAPAVNVDGYLRSFTANVAFVGNAEVPTPGAGLLLSAATLIVMPRRKR